MSKKLLDSSRKLMLGEWSQGGVTVTVSLEKEAIGRATNYRITRLFLAKVIQVYNPHPVTELPGRGGGGYIIGII